GGGAQLPTDRDGVPTLEGLRGWMAARIPALQDETTAAFSHCAKVIEDGYNRVNEMTQQHHSTVSALLQSSSEALDLARSQHATALGDIEAIYNGVLEETGSLRSELQEALRNEVRGPLEARIAMIQAKYKIG
ncbi:hypothetical protein Vretifemale_20805, partial [Volvox reticuliferus]